MAKILEFRLPEPKPKTRDEYLSELLTSKEAVDAILVGMLTEVIPMWVEKQWPFSVLEVMAHELRSAMSINVPKEVSRYQVEAIVDELKPVWRAIAEQATCTL